MSADLAAPGQDGQELAGCVAIVTGGGRNIGRAIALTLARAGACIAICGRSDQEVIDATVRNIEAIGGKALGLLADVTDAAAVERLVGETAARFGGIDILVNNAAGRPEQPLETMTLADWQGVLATILDGAFLTTKACLPWLKRGGAGAIVNIGGLSGHIGTRHRVHVVTAKAGLVGFTRALAHELAEHKVTANCVVPGLIGTERDPAAALPQHHQVSRTLTGRLGTPRRLPTAVRYLASARYVTGQSLHVNGGAYLG